MQIRSRFVSGPFIGTAATQPERRLLLGDGIPPVASPTDPASELTVFQRSIGVRINLVLGQKENIILAIEETACLKTTADGAISPS